MRRARADVHASDAARELISRWVDAIGYRVATLPTEWLRLADLRLADVGADTCARALEGIASSPWHNAPDRRSWARLPGYVLRSPDRVLSVAETARRRDAGPSHPKKVQAPAPAPATSPAAAAANAASARELLESLNRNRNPTE